MKKILILIMFLALTAGVAHASEARIVRDGVVGCISEDYFKKLRKIAAQKDAEALKQGIMAGLDDGKCALFKKGEKIFINDSNWSGMRKIRREGEFDEYWTTDEAVGQ